MLLMRSAMKRYFPLTAAFMATTLAADIPIHEVILYKSGVGYFERTGALRPGESARLDFKASDMNDVLKSLTIEDRTGSKVTGLRYDSSEPLDRKLADFPFRIDGQASLAVFMDQMKGAKVEIKYGAETVSGAIVSGRLVGADDKHPEREQVVLMLDSGELRTFDLAAASTIRFVDPKLQGQLRDYLTMVNQSRSQDKRSIYIDSSDVRARQIDANYTIPMPVWKSSYRLIFNDKTDPTLEGWAIIDNTTGEDWTNVVLAVVSGRPVSFISKLYEPKYVPRQTVELPEDRAAAPVVYSGAVAGGVAGGHPVAIGGLAPAPPPGLGEMRMQALPSAGRSDKELENLSSLAVDVASADFGELFEYRFATPVTVKKDESAMLPFLQQKIGARKLLIYSENYGEHPMSAAEFDQLHRQNTGWRADHRIRGRKLFGRGSDDHAESRRQAPDQLCSRFRNAGDHGVRFQSQHRSGDPRESRNTDRPVCDARDQDLQHSEHRRQNQDTGHRADPAAGIQGAQPQAHREHRDGESVRGKTRPGFNREISSCRRARVRHN